MDVLLDVVSDIAGLGVATMEQCSPRVVSIWPCHSGSLFLGNTSEQSSMGVETSMWLRHCR